jgi:hypothetical protein
MVGNISFQNKEKTGANLLQCRILIQFVSSPKKWYVLFCQPKNWLGQYLSPPALYVLTGLLKGKAYSLYFTVVKRRSTFQTFFDFSTLVE